MAPPIHFDADLIKRYDRHGPRYTSYPTALQFTPTVNQHAYRAAALLSNAQATALSLYVHVPFCGSPCFYCGCNKVIARSPDKAARYVAALKREIDMQAAMFLKNRRVQQLHFGGGTPTFLTGAQLREIIAHLADRFSLTRSPQREYSIEIDPRTVDALSIAALADLGFNRFSLGVQDFDPRVQAAVNRVQSMDSVRQVVDAARRCGVNAIGFDLIYGLPRQSVAGFMQTLELVTEMRPSSVAVYAYAHMPQIFKPQRLIDAAELPSPAQRLQLQQLTIARLTAAGYIYIGLDHFALPEDRLARALAAGTLRRDFQGYSALADGDLIGLGASAIGKVGDVYAQNAKSLREYYTCIEGNRLAVTRGIKLNSDDRVRRDVIQQLMCRGTVSFDSIERDHCIEFEEYFAAEIRRLAPFAQDGLLVNSDTEIRVTDRGRLLVRNIAMVFDAYLHAAEVTQFSKAI